MSTEHIDGSTEKNLGDHTPMSSFSQNKDFSSGHRPPPVIVSSDFNRQMLSLQDKRMVIQKDLSIEKSFEKGRNANDL